MNLLEPLSTRTEKFRTGELSRDDWLAAVDDHVRTADPRYKAFAEWRPASTSDLGNGGDFLVTYKDTIDIAGFATRLGSSAGYRHYPVESAGVAKALQRGRFRCVGKVATTEFGLGTNTTCVNPRFPDFSPSGSSTGSAVAVAAGFCDLSIGTDSRGSIRWPAGNCGVVGLRLTTRADLQTGIFPVSQSMDSIGVITRSVADLSFLWERGGLGESLSFPQRSSAARNPRLAIAANYEEFPCHPEIRETFELLVEKLSEARARVGRQRLRWWDFRKQAWALLVREAYDVHRRFGQDREIAYEPGTMNTIMLGRGIKDREYEALKADQKRAAALAEEDFERGGADVLLLPLDSQLPRDLRTTPPPETSMPVKPPERDPSSGQQADMGFADIASFAKIPALTLPMGTSASGAPIAVQLMARRGGEAELIAAGSLIERLVSS